MCKGLIGKKLGMTGYYSTEGSYIPVTVIRIGPCVVTQIKRFDSDGYDAIQLGFGEKKISQVNRPMMGHFNKSGKGAFQFLKEFAVDEPDNYKPGQSIGSEIFQIGDMVNVTGTTKGRGFSGVIKRHGFHGGRETHGSKNHRRPGSIGCSAWPAKVIKGKKMPGHYGSERKTIKNIEIMDIRIDENIMMLKGATPGPGSGLVIIQKILN